VASLNIDYSFISVIVTTFLEELALLNAIYAIITCQEKLSQYLPNLDQIFKWWQR